MSKTAALVGALGAFGALAYLMAPLPPEEQAPGTAATASAIAPSQPSNRKPATVARVSAPTMQPTQGQDTNVRLVQQIQTELLRLGCYAGAVDGRWSPETQQAMQALGERVRVLRPVDTPDYIMLALARSQASLACTPRGQATASRQPARIVPMAATGHTVAEPSRSGPSTRRAADRPPNAADTRTRAQTPQQEGRHTAASRAPLDRPAASPADDEAALQRDYRDAEPNRMGLGAAAGSPLDAPRQIAPQVGASHQPRRTPRTAAETRPRSTASSRGDWKRTVFNKLKFDGP